MRFFDLRHDVLHGGRTGLIMLRHFEDDEALAGAGGVGRIPDLQRKGLVFEHLGQRAALEQAQVASLRSRGTAGVLLRQLGKVAAFGQLRA